jgi:CubicO group peptidase (beta-lactamase class C family)
MRIVRALGSALAVASLSLAFGLVPHARAQQRFSAGAVPPARFADPERTHKLAAAFPEIEKIVADWFAKNPAPGAVVGIVVDGELAWVKAAGVANVENKTPVTPDTVFRIASMTKSFTAMSILKLRDEGRLSLDDPAAKYIPELASLPYPTKDSPAITVRHLLTHSEGFPEDNPWGDRQLAQPEETLREWLRAGIPFSTSPGTAFEYSNYGFELLGEIVARVSGKPYDKYVRDNILVPLKMTSTTFHQTDVPRDRIALGYRWEDETWKPEPILAHGTFGAMGGLWTTAGDLAKYVAFLLSAFPPRDDAETGPIRRSSAREMQQGWRYTGARASRETVDGPLRFGAGAYGYGLGNSTNCYFETIVAHSGGLPGYGSLMRWLPDYGVGLVGMTNKTYTSPGAPMNDALLALVRTGALLPRVPQPSAALLAAQSDVSKLVTSWDDALAARIVADNFFLDRTAERRAAIYRDLVAKHGACRSVGPIEAENALRGKWRITCDRGWLEVSITLAPTMPPKVQALGVASVLPPSPEMQKLVDAVATLMKGWDQQTFDGVAAPGLDVAQVRRQLAAAAAWGTCSTSELFGGDGTSVTAMKMKCEKGGLVVRVTGDATTYRLTGLTISPSPDERCVP